MPDRARAGTIRMYQTGSPVREGVIAMGESTAIAWTDHTFNPWWGCTRVSPACDHCYAEAFAKRTGHIVWGKDAPRRLFGDKHWAEPLRWNDLADRNGVRARVFCASMADVFERRQEDAILIERQRLWSLVAATPHLDWQLLTKRPENVLNMVPGDWLVDWPANVWIGTTVENQRYADLRIPKLLEVPAHVRFLSMEPLLGRVHLPEAPGIGWVIVGGESGGGYRPLDLDDARSLRDQCEILDVPFFFKQVGGRFPHSGGDQLDGRTHKAFPSSAVPA